MSANRLPPFVSLDAPPWGEPPKAPGDDLVSRFSRPGLHEFYCAHVLDHPAALALACCLVHRIAGDAPILLIWQSEIGDGHASPYPHGFVELGLDPTNVMIVRSPDTLSSLQAGLEGARCSALGAVLIETRGEAKAYDLTASRRLALAAKTSGTPVFLLRVAARPQPSAAGTRWLVRAAPSHARAAGAPGNPLFDLTLLRARNGRTDLRYLVEWDRNVRDFITCAVTAADAAVIGISVRHAGASALSGAVVPLFLDRSGEPEEDAFRKTG